MMSGMATPKFLHPYARPAADRDTFVTIVRGEGAAVFDVDGKRYVDALASLWYCNVGHGRGEIVDAVTAQLKQLDSFHSFDRFTNEPAEQLAATVADVAPIDDARVFLTSSGSEAVDSAIKLARITMTARGEPHRQLIVSRTNAYHGVTYGGLSVQGLPANQAGFGPLLPEVVHVDHAELADVERVFAERGDQIAAVLAEPVIGAGGVYPPSPGYLEGLRRLCDEHNALLVLDEVICGFGRLGSWFGAQHYGVRPDAVVFAKGVTSGYQPLGGVAMGRAMLDPLEADPTFLLRHGHTYSGHPAATAAGLVNIDILRRESLLDRAKPIGERLSAGLQELARDGLVEGVRGDGAMWAAVLPDGVDGTQVRDRMLAEGVIARPIGMSVIAFCPPLVIDDADIDQCVAALETALT
jgi:adenosylmethionine-8-amino-7-oxononanoate aminotransferase